MLETDRSKWREPPVALPNAHGSAISPSEATWQCRSEEGCRWFPHLTFEVPRSPAWFIPRGFSEKSRLDSRMSDSKVPHMPNAQMRKTPAQPPSSWYALAAGTPTPGGALAVVRPTPRGPLAASRCAVSLPAPKGRTSGAHHGREAQKTRAARFLTWVDRPYKWGGIKH